ncbi:protein of unknown function DUF2837 [Gottschalkia purinilytica]|uniref:Lipid II flippase Amj n=1 Tax=Gottschalkia purinilytica TaxID=1503 RepID=A0A0L0WEP8_GOTPU|nr:lipid II flippase Amj family protein [Gottschalkia purinilytica]KNF09900.1 protein of unknown function DUF2837 [Gottschalkia purinilytica]
MSYTLLMAMILTAMIHTVETLAYSVRLSSVKNKQYALCTSLFNIFVLISRTANTFLAPLIGTIVGYSISKKIDPIMDFRLLVFSSTIGTVVGIFFMPTFLRIFEVAVSKLEVYGSVPLLVSQSLSISNIKRIAKKTSLPKKSMIEKLNIKNIPKKLIILNTLITGIYTVGMYSSFYASTLVSSSSRIAASASSGMVNGIATILLTIFVDPKSAIITDQVLRGERSYNDVKSLVTLLIVSKLVGTLLGQILLIPSANIIALIYR